MAEAEELKYPAEWCHLYGVTLLDPDGWRKDGKKLSEPLTHKDWAARMAESTVQLQFGSKWPESMEILWP